MLVLFAIATWVPLGSFNLPSLHSIAFHHPQPALVAASPHYENTCLKAQKPLTNGYIAFIPPLRLKYSQGAVWGRAEPVGELQ